MTAPALALLQVVDRQQPMVSTSAYVLATLVKIIYIFTVYMLGAAALTLVERRVCAWMQDRLGPNRVGPQGLFQPLADGLKNIMKEETYPSAANLPMFILAPVMSFVPAMIVGSVIPFASPAPSKWGLIDMVVAPLPVGFLFILAIASLGVYGIVMAGWSSNNKYSLLGGLRSSAQMVSYEIAMGMSTIPVLLLAGNVSLNHIIAQQQLGGFNWNVVNLTIAFFIFLVSAFAETNRLPFDLPEAESELIAGYHSEYSAMKFSLFFIAEYGNMITTSALMATLFFGGWDIPGTWDTPPWTWLKTIATLIVFAIKTSFFIFLYMWIRWTLPRFRYDQLMALGWKIMLPIALGYIVVVAAALLGLQVAGFAPGTWQFRVSLIVLNLILVALVFGWFDRGRLISPAYSRLDPRRVEKLRHASRDRAAFRPAEGD
jgi:NADH-quinone oxidoreductase subunit H